MSRLDRLVLLLDTGSSAFIRNTAADQLSDSAKSHPEEILNILARVYPYLKSRKWETRIAAARAFGGIVASSPVWNPNEIKEEPLKNNKVIGEKHQVHQSNTVKTEDNGDLPLKIKEEEVEGESEPLVKIDPEKQFEKIKEVLSTSDNVKLSDLNFGRLINDCPKLVASGVSLLDLNNNKDLMENLKLTKQLLNARLGYGDPSILIKQEQEYKRLKKESEQNRMKKEKEDLAIKQKEEELTKNSVQSQSSQSKGSAARLRAMARRRAKQQASNQQNKNAPVDLSQSSLSSSVEKDEPKVVKTEPAKFELTSQADANTLVMETKVSSIAFDESVGVSDKIWKFQGLYELLVFDLFNPNWEIRHGSALGLQELLKDHAKSINRIRGYTIEENNRRNLDALEDLVAKILTLFALDRFGDYIGDSVVAPVRESTAQALAALLVNIDESVAPEKVLLEKIFNKLIELVVQDPVVFQLTIDKNRSSTCWEASHGAILGLKYIVTIKSDFIFRNDKVFQSVISVVLDGLQNHIEEIQSESAALLIPILDHILPYNKWLTKIVKTIWNILESIHDDLKSSLNNILNLISSLAEYPEVLKLMKDMSSGPMTIQENGDASHYYSFENLMPKLYPFFRHSISNIRKSVLQTFLSFLNIKESASAVSSSRQWFQDPLLFRLVFQNLLFEQHPDILALSEKVFRKIVNKNLEYNELVPCSSSIEDVFKIHSTPLLNLILVPLGINRLNYHMNNSDVLKPNGEPYSNETQTNNSMQHKRGRKRKSPPADVMNKVSGEEGYIASSATPSDSEHPSSADLHVNIDAPILKGDIALLGIDVFIRTRIAASKAYGFILSSFNSDGEILNIFTRLKQSLNSNLSTPRIYSAMIIEEYFVRLGELNKHQNSVLVNLIQPVLLKYLNEPEKLPYYRELVPSLKAVRNNCSELFLRFEENGGVPHSKIPLLPVIVQGEKQAGNNAFSVADAEKVVNQYYTKLFKLLSGASKFTASEALENSKQVIVQAIENINELKSSRNITILSSFAGAALKIYINADSLPPKLNPFIRCLMDSIKSDSELYQYNTAKSVAALIYKLVDSKKSKIYEKVVKNLCSYLSVQFPEFQPNRDLHNVIFSLEIQKSVAKLNSYENSHITKVLGAKTTLYMIIEYYGNEIFDRLPILQKSAFDSSKSLLITDENVTYEDDKIAQSIIDSMGIIETISPKLNEELLFGSNLDLNVLLRGLKSKYSIFRYAASKCLAILCKHFPIKTIPFVVTNVLPLLKNSGFLSNRQGAIETIYHLSNIMGADILPYVIFFIVPVLGRMSDSDPNIRVLATTTFASIIKLVPLEAGIEDPQDMPKDLLEGREKERSFIRELMNPKEIPDYELPVAIKATLRSYQKSGVNWLHFLNKYNLHGILCDDMGLGKTLQTICIVSSDHHNRIEQFAKTGLDEFKKLPSLVVCPPSVMGHWEQEINQYAPFLSVLVYSGSPTVRNPLRTQFDSADIIVTSYDVMRNDVEFVATKNFNYAVLDEGHIIKNANSKLSKSVKRIRAEHRLILTGTPIQNNVLELWSLFDFLMPGFLGTEKYFQEKFSKPIAASRNSKTSSKEQEKGALALEALHKQVLPFMLRRLKSEVLNDLPPKIIQDRYCELSDIQKALYKDFVKKKKNVVEEDLKNAIQTDEGEGNGKQHIFQALQYMRKLCNHPSLVLSSNHPNYMQVQQYLKDSKSDIDDIRHAPKLLDLKNLLIECGIGASSSSASGSLKKHLSEKQQKQQEQQQLLSDGVISQHRALIFCQLKEMLDKVEEDLLKKHLPNVTYMRLDGSTEPRMRQQLVTKFNSDPSIDVLLLTTRVGGLGLNLTGADTVIFVEHDWNPMNDLQAMDRAHRLGQTKAVNVYRLITRHTLEEKIMSLQQFKVNVASAVVSQQNNNLNSMDTDQLLDLFDVDDKDDGLGSNGGEAEKNGDGEDGPIDDLGLGGKAKKALGSLADMWDNSQYEDEYNVKNFVDRLASRKK
ncbi:hypothetical protein DASC09_050900 [Saccharomycopsis crataegensis]|uniref:TATA-binding protein-associated factor mot1 n=1 Tax=Saccharomycopsis crataegensis TaxID=43959 RepID=A0AAV5QS71_9ASCO|nr:hypothetical protein DASC09_050900 [Saccharomycopsis crataegensis]